MSEKQRQKKDGEDKNKDQRRMRTRNADLDVPFEAGGSRTGRTKADHRIPSVREGYRESK